MGQQGSDRDGVAGEIGGAPSSRRTHPQPLPGREGSEVGEGGPPRPRKPFTRWTADTETAFLLALRQTGQVRKTAAEIGRTVSGAYGRRKLNPGFARRWDEMVAAQQAEWIAETQARLDAEHGPGEDDGAGGERLVPGRERVDGWTSRLRQRFLHALRRSKNVTAACAAAGVSRDAAYALRARSPRFAQAWARALEADTPSVREAAWARAVEGWMEPVFHGGRQIGERRRYSDGLMRELLRAELAPPAPRGTAKANGDKEKLPKWYRPRSLDEVRESILRKLDAIDRARQAGEDPEEWERKHGYRPGRDGKI